MLTFIIESWLAVRISNSLVLVQLGMAGPRVTTAFDEHKNIVQAISNRDAELAEILMRRHLQYTRNSLEKRLTANLTQKTQIKDVT